MVGKAAADALGAPVDPDNFLARAVELEQALANRAIALHAMPDLMGGETAIALVDEGALETVLAIGLGETIQPVGSVGSLVAGTAIRLPSKSNREVVRMSLLSGFPGWLPERRAARSLYH